MPKAKQIRVNDRDIQTLATVGEYGLLDRQLCHALCFADKSLEWCRQNLCRLADAGLIETTKLRVWHDEAETRGGRVPILYSLTKDGAETVYLRTGTFPKRVLRSAPSAATFYHRLQIVRCRFAFDEAARREGLPPPQWIMEQDMLGGALKELMPQQRRVLFHEFRQENSLLTCRPDAAALLKLPHPSGNAADATTLAVHFEIDRSREGVTQCVAKNAAYALVIQEKTFERYWPHLQNSKHRVFWVVPSKQRIESLAAAMRKDAIAPLLRFTTVDDCTPTRVLTEPVWFDVQGTAMTLFQRPAAAKDDP